MFENLFRKQLNKSNDPFVHECISKFIMAPKPESCAGIDDDELKKHAKKVSVHDELKALNMSSLICTPTFVTDRTMDAGDLVRLIKDKFQT